MLNFLPFIFKLFHYTLFDTLSYNNNARDALWKYWGFDVNNVYQQVQEA